MKVGYAIAKNTTLKVLSLSNNNISDEGAKHLADALKENNTLQTFCHLSQSYHYDAASFLVIGYRIALIYEEECYMSRKVKAQGHTLYHTYELRTAIV